MDIVNLLTLLIGGGLFAFIQWLVDKIGDALGKKDKTAKAIEDLAGRIDKLQATIEERDAVNARSHILRFADELYNDQRHSKDYFQQILQDVDIYEKYCDQHPDFKNNMTILATSRIKETYHRLDAEHKFL